MRNFSFRMFWVATFLLNSVMAGCGREQTPVPIPMVIAVTPANGASAVPITQVITASFNQVMNAATLNANTFLVMGPGGTTVNGIVGYSGTTASFTPTVSLAPGTVYTATITTGAQDLFALPIAANFIWSFTTEPAPIVLNVNPGNGAVNVPLNQKITATFSEPMNSATILAGGTFTLAVAGGGAAVAGSVSYIAASNSAIFAPGATLAASTHYTATITTAAQSAGGNALASNFVWSFTTGTTSNVTAPVVIATVPIPGATNVPTNTLLTATFSKVMDPATITAPGTFSLVVTAGSAAVAGTVHYAGATATFAPTADLTANTQFTATVTTAAKDLTGNALAANFVWSFTTGAGPDAVAPAITLTSPADGDLDVSLNKSINATFSKSMDPVTLLTPSTFTLAVGGAGGAAVAGTVTYDAINNIAIFAPSANLLPNTSYTATISKAATDLAANPLATGTKPNPWTFMTGTTLNGQLAPNLASAATFGSFGGGAGMTNQGINTVINGDIGTTGVSTLVTGFHDASPGCTYTETGSDMGMVNGNIDTAPPPPAVACPEEGTSATFAIATQAATDALAAYLDLTPASRPGGTDPGAGQLGGLVLPPGIYQAALGSFLITGSDLTLDAQGDANAVWVFQMASSLTVGAPGFPRSVILVNGAQAKNVFWQVGSAATINAAGGGTMVGTIMAFSGISFSTPGNAAITTLNGRAWGLNASVTMVNTVINVPAP